MQGSQFIEEMSKFKMLSDGSQSLVDERLRKICYQHGNQKK